MKNKIILVGTGDYYTNIAPTLKQLEKDGVADLVGTISLEKRRADGLGERYEECPHFIRKESEDLSKIVKKMSSDNAHQEYIVILGHANDWHTKDAKELVQNGIKVIVEKPYSIDSKEMRDLEDLTRSEGDKIAFSEYYLKMKALPLLAATGELETNSFYFNKKGIIEAKKGLTDMLGQESKNRDISGRIFDLIGKPKFITSNVLEGDSKVGNVDNRGSFLTAIDEGGDMVNDIFIHAAAPLFGIQNYIGKINESFSEGKVRGARCKEYMDMARRQFGLQDSNIGVSYAEVEFETSKGVKVFSSIGKYVYGDRNHRGITIVGSEGLAHLDMSNPALFIRTGDQDRGMVLETPKLAEKYYSVIRGCIEELNGKSPFRFNANRTCMDTQKFIFNVRDKVYQQPIAEYWTGEQPSRIFKK